MLSHLQFPHGSVMHRLDPEPPPASIAAAPHLSAIPAAPWLRWATRVAVLALGAGAAACGGKAAGPPTLQQVATLTMQAQPTSLTQEYPAQLEASNTVEIRPQVAGILYRQAALEGTPVKRGQTLFEIDPQPYIVAPPPGAGGGAHTAAA